MVFLQHQQKRMSSKSIIKRNKPSPPPACDYNVQVENENLKNDLLSPGSELPCDVFSQSLQSLASLWMEAASREPSLGFQLRIPVGRRVRRPVLWVALECKLALGSATRGGEYRFHGQTSCSAFQLHFPGSELMLQCELVRLVTWTPSQALTTCRRGQCRL